MTKEQGLRESQKCGGPWISWEDREREENTLVNCVRVDENKQFFLYNIGGATITDNVVGDPRQGPCRLWEDERCLSQGISVPKRHNCKFNP